MLICVPLGALFINTLLPYFFSQAIGGLASRNIPLIRDSLIAGSVIGLLGVLCNLLGFQMVARHEASASASLGNATFRRLINKDFQFFVNEKVGALTSRYIDFIRSHTILQDLLVTQTLGFVLSVGVGLVIVASHSLLLALVIFVLLTALILQVRWSIKKRAPWRHERKALAGEINGTVADAVTNNLVVKTFAGEKQEIAHLAKQNQRFHDIYLKDVGFIMYEGTGRVAIMVVTQIVTIALCGYLVFNHQMSLAVAIFTLTYLQRIASQLFNLGSMLNGFDQALLEAAPMSDILAQTTVINDTSTAFDLAHITPTIDFEAVSYRYGDANEVVFQDITLHIKAGEKIGLVGHSGTGKTTLTHLLLRFADVTSGAIYISGKDIRHMTQHSLRQHIAYVPQEPLLFHRSLRDNIAYGKPDASDADVRRAASQAHAIDFIDRLPQGLDTLVGERGVKLSGGQRQRIAIARAILKDAPILVLDEATSALDSESEKLIQSALQKLMKDRTSIVIAHRLSTIAKLDRIIVLDNGIVAEEGTHTQLLEQNGIYAKFWAHQSGGFIED